MGQYQGKWNRGKGELQGALKRLKGFQRMFLKALWKQQHLGLKTKSGLRPNSKEYRGFMKADNRDTQSDNKKTNIANACT